MVIMDREPTFSSDSAFEGKLEKRAFDQERVDEDEESHRMRIREWHKQFLEFVGSRSATNMTEVAYASYIQGRKILTEDLEDDEVENLEALADIGYRLSNFDGNEKYNDEETITLNATIEIDDPNESHGPLEHVETFKFRSSIVSDIKQSYEGRGGFGPWIHRALMTMGFITSENIEGKAEKRTIETTENVYEAYTQAVKNREENIREFVALNWHTWIEEGIYKGRLELIEDAVDIMETEERDEVETYLEIIKERAEVIEGRRR